MDYNVEFKIMLPDELLKTFGIDRDTAFEAYFEDGAIKVRILDEDEDIYGIDDFNEDDCDLEDCTGCPYFCEKCGACLYDEE